MSPGPSYPCATRDVLALEHLYPPKTRKPLRATLVRLPRHLLHDSAAVAVLGGQRQKGRVGLRERGEAAL